MIELKPIKPEAVTSEEIFLKGKVIGTVEQKETGSPFHACISLPGRPGHYLSTLLLQGHGRTPEDAIQVALDNAEKDAHHMLDSVEKLRQEMKA